MPRPAGSRARYRLTRMIVNASRPVVERRRARSVATTAAVAPGSLPLRAAVIAANPELRERAQLQAFTAVS